MVKQLPDHFGSKLGDNKGLEGITYDLDSKNLYLVTDKGHRLYRYEVK